MAIETQNKLSRSDVEDMNIGQTRTFALPNFAKLKSARANLREYSLASGKKFATKADLQNSILTITRTA